MSKLNSLAGIATAVGIAAAPVVAKAAPGPAQLPGLQGVALEPGAELAEDLVRIEAIESRGLVGVPQLTEGGRQAYAQVIERSRVQARVKCGDALHPHWALQVEDAYSAGELLRAGRPLVSIQPIIDPEGRATGNNLVTFDANQGSQTAKLTCTKNPPPPAGEADREDLTIRVDTRSTTQSGLMAPGMVIVPPSAPSPSHDYGWVERQEAEEDAAIRTPHPGLRLNLGGTFPDLGLNAGGEWDLTPENSIANFGAGAGVFVAQGHETIDNLDIPGGTQDIEPTIMGIRGVAAWTPELGTQVLRARVAVAIAAAKALETTVAGQHVAGDWAARGEIELGLRLGNENMGVTVGGVGATSPADAGQSFNAFLTLDKKL